MAVELRGRCMDVFSAIWWRCKACITTTLRSTACVSLVLRTEACRMTREEYNALARQVANARKTQRQSKQCKAVCEWDTSRRGGTMARASSLAWQKRLATLKSAGRGHGETLSHGGRPRPCAVRCQPLTKLQHLSSGMCVVSACAHGGRVAGGRCC